MPYRNKTYVAFDADSDIRYYRFRKLGNKVTIQNLISLTHRFDKYLANTVQKKQSREILEKD